VLSLVVSAGLAFLLQSRVTAPILIIAGVAREMARTHQFRRRVPVSSSDEVGALATSFNLMLQQLEERDNDLAKHRDQLEHEVAERSRINAELHQAKDKAESAVRIKAEFLANMSHEIRTPLNGVSGMINLAYEACESPQIREQLGIAQTAAQSLITIVNDILDFSKAEAGKMTLELLNFNLSRTLEESFQLFTLTARQKNLALKYTVEDSCPTWVRGDPVRLRQVLVNLIGNAVKFTAEGSVHLHVRPTGSHSMMFEVRDTGIGIPAHKLQTIFEPFTQADGSHTRRFGGSGLGLAITQRLVKLMNGKLWAETELSRGSCFFVEVPLPAGVEEAAVESKPTQLTLRPLNVLVAEDNFVNQKVICGLLKRQDWSTTVVGDGAKAIVEFSRGVFDLILMDVQMPNVDGLEATRTIRKEEAGRGLKRTPILALTAHASPSQHAMCLESGMDGVVVKPINKEVLFNRVREVVECSGVYLPATSSTAS
jgi:two-component system, sensor histidine kinase